MARPARPPTIANSGTMMIAQIRPSMQMARVAEHVDRDGHHGRDESNKSRSGAPALRQYTVTTPTIDRRADDEGCEHRGHRVARIAREHETHEHAGDGARDDRPASSEGGSAASRIATASITAGGSGRSHAVPARAGQKRHRDLSSGTGAGTVSQLRSRREVLRQPQVPDEARPRDKPDSTHQPGSHSPGLKTQPRGAGKGVVIVVPALRPSSAAKSSARCGPARRRRRRRGASGHGCARESR